MNHYTSLPSHLHSAPYNSSPFDYVQEHRHRRWARSGQFISPSTTLTSQSSPRPSQVALRLTRLLTPKHTVTSIIRDSAHATDITAASATPLVLSIEDSTPADFAKVFMGKDVVYYTAGSGGKGGEARHKSADHEGAVKVFDAIEAVEGPKPRLILISSVDVRDLKKPAPSHYVRFLFFYFAGGRSPS